MNQNLWGWSLGIDIVFKAARSFYRADEVGYYGWLLEIRPMCFSGSNPWQRRGVEITWAFPRDFFLFFPFVCVLHSASTHGWTQFTCHTDNTVQPLSLHHVFALWVWENKMATEILRKYAVLVLAQLGIPSPVTNSIFTLLGSGFTKKSITVICLG